MTPTTTRVADAGNANGGTTQTASVIFSQPVEKIDYVMTLPIQRSTCQDDRGIPLTCYLVRFPALHGVAYNAAGQIVASDMYIGGGTAGVDLDQTVLTSMSLYSAASDIVRVDFITDTPSDWTLGYAAFGGATLLVTCTPAQVVRGTPTLCTASLSDGATPAVTAWHFASENSLQPTLSVDGPAGTTWGGAMVISGTVTATATVAGGAQTASSGVRVIARDWSADTVAYTLTEVATPYGDPPRHEHDLGSNQQEAHVRADVYATVASGPNANAAYFTALPYRLSFAVNYNTKAMVAGSLFYQMQPPTAQTYNGTRYCARSRVISDILLVKVHEGFSASDRNSHTDVYTRYFLDTVRAAAEQLVAAEATSLDPGGVGEAAHQVAFAQSHAITDLSPANPYHSDCVFNYNPTLRIP